MTKIICKTVYFEKLGPQNTEETLKLAKERAKDAGVDDRIKFEGYALDSC